MNLKKALSALVAVTSLSALPVSTAQASVEPYLGQISWFAFNFCPRGWTKAEGQILPISQNQALFSLYGSAYGGDGRTSFGLPDLRGRSITGIGSGSGLQSRNLGEKYGVENVTLTTQNLPSHNHRVNVSDNSDSTQGADAVLGKIKTKKGKIVECGENGCQQSETINIQKGVAKLYDSAGTTSSQLADETISHTGNNQAVNVLNPSLVMTPCVALTGIFPSRS